MAQGAANGQAPTLQFLVVFPRFHARSGSRALQQQRHCFGQPRSVEMVLSVRPIAVTMLNPKLEHHRMDLLMMSSKGTIPQQYKAVPFSHLWGMFF